jgi:hypothetical protein
MVLPCQCRAWVFIVTTVHFVTACFRSQQPRQGQAPLLPTLELTINVQGVQDVGRGLDHLQLAQARGAGYRDAQGRLVPGIVQEDRDDLLILENAARPGRMRSPRR